jgi:hypothetical protein
MEETQTPKRTGRSILALFAGFVAVVVLSLGMDVILHATKIFPPVGKTMTNALFALATAYRIVFAVIGSYITAKLAPYRAMLHAMIGGFIGLVLSIVGAAVTWNKPELGPHWYPLALVVTALPCAWLGGKIYEMTASRA